ncbi:10207_t:CDS:2, partial [Cetraspora pellucida]
MSKQKINNGLCAVKNCNKDPNVFWSLTQLAMKKAIVNNGIWCNVNAFLEYLNSEKDINFDNLKEDENDENDIIDKNDFEKED